jgi:hypothetical protein
MTIDFDPARIVPSVRDLNAALAMRRRSLALVPLISSEADLSVAAALQVRAFAVGENGPLLQSTATMTRDVPVLSLARCERPEDCQRARYFGADGVCIDAADADAADALAAHARSMRMLPLRRATNAAGVEALESRGARAIVVACDSGEVQTVASSVSKGAVLLVDARARDLPPQELRNLLGHVDVVIVRSTSFGMPGFAALLDELDN